MAIEIDPSTPRGAKKNLQVRRPNANDGAAVNRLISHCDPLDENSMYCNLLQCSHFADTSALAEGQDDVLGFVSGYLLPKQAEKLFIWQVAVAPQARGQRLAQRMILDILQRPACHKVRELHTTITPTNKPSQALFSSVAEALDAEVDTRVLFDREAHFDGEQSSEVLWRLGPFEREALLPKLSGAA